MAYDNGQNDLPLPKGSNQKRTSVEHLPKFFRTEVNNKFLSSTIDQLIQPGAAEKLNGYFGRKQAKAFSTDDFYIGDVSQQRENYQFEPAAVIKDQLDNVSFYADYSDYINQIKNLGGYTDNHSQLNQQEYYAWNPHIDWDKFANFREYYWLPNGPTPVPVSGDSVSIASTYSVSIVDNLDNFGFVFTPDGLTQNPELTLYRGVTYRFEINAPGVPLSFRSQKTTAKRWSAGTLFTVGETVVYEGTVYQAVATHRSNDTLQADSDKWEIDTTFNLVNEVSQQGVEQGVIELTLNQNTPEYIYYVSDTDINAGGLIRVYDAEEAAFIDVENEILGKTSYTTGDGFELSNGMKIYFQGTTRPDTFQTGFYYVEGVGDAIQLIPESDLTLAGAFVDNESIEFDSEGFDTIPYSTAIGYPREKDYLTINRTSIDGNLWSKYNRWFHRSVVERSAEITGVELLLDQNQRATRPIIEFEPNLKLFNFGTVSKQPVDLVDDFTVDAFSIIEGKEGYNIDGVDIANGMRVLFTADTDIRVKNQIYQVQFITFKGRRQIALIPADDTEALENESVFVGQGNVYKGSILYFNGQTWKQAQNKEQTNQPPLFDIFNCDGDSLSDSTVYVSTDFAGTELFSYKQGAGSADSELGFPLAYRSIENVGDIVFEFDLLTDSATFCPDGEMPQQEKTSAGYLRRYQSRIDFELENGWKIANEPSYQSVTRQFEAETNQTDFAVDVYDNSGLLDDLSVKVFINGFYTTDYTIETRRSTAFVILNNPVDENDVVRLQTRSSQPKNNNGFYEIPINLERNPLNRDVDELTLGEVNDHVGTIIEELDQFQGEYPGSSNLRDLGDITGFGKRIVKHSAPLNLALYHLLDKNANVVKSLRFAKTQYAKFKREFLQLARDLPDSGNVRQQVETILRELTKNSKNTDAFYFSDMIPRGGSRVFRFEITSDQQTFFGLNNPFTLDTSSDQAVLVYLNGNQLMHGYDYRFNSEGFIELTAGQVRDDVLEVYEYESTTGSYIPPTPTKLGIFPSFVPEKQQDDTYIDATDVIVGHDGSRIIAFNDFRDDLLLELEKRIYNNLKVEYNEELFDIHNYQQGTYRSEGIAKSNLDTSLLVDFTEWLRLIDNDFTENPVYDRQNPFTWNHTGMTNWKGDSISGSWRNVYQNAYDTDAPHLRPWEMLGFSQKPDWWQQQYGPAPYTRGNLLLWEDIQQGIVREPGQTPIVYEKFARPGLTGHLPVDDAGNLVSPMASGYVDYYNSQLLDKNYQFGDWSPVETAWRKSSEYAFALLTAFVLNRPNSVFATVFDRTRQFRDLSGQISYQDENTQIQLENIDLPNTVQDSQRVFTSGLVNYVRDYITSNVTVVYDDYKSDIAALNNQIGFKLAGLTSKEKFKLILDSRTPNNQGNVFVPEENYQIFFNTSVPIENIYYSGVVIEKRPSGFTVRGYNNQQPYFKYFKSLPANSDSTETIGGISANVIEWDAEKTLTKGKIVEYENSIYRVTETHQTAANFDSSKFVKLPDIPIEGGRTAKFRTRFESQESEIRYGESFSEIQDVVDFLLGYGAWLESKGFVFDYYESDNGLVTDWKTSAREFLFWTTQNWEAGAVIALSPAGIKFRFVSEFATVDNVYDTFYGYSLTKADGKKLQPGNVSVARINPNEFDIRTKNTADGIFGIRISLIQKEHAVIIDNRTVFGDIIYDQEPGYRQERIKVLGYRTAEWDGSINVPGFVYDDAKAEEWQPWRDYAIGDIVNYKEFYYAARNRVPGTAVFEARNWVRLPEKPSGGLLPNWEYKTNQFADFYDLDTDNFDAEQQKFAQHLIGYQNRNYLANIINDDVSQYKFYQGFIQDKGTENAFKKLFDVLGSANRDSLEFYEEWAIKSGQYGAVDGFEEVEYLLDEQKFRTEPQPFQLTNQTSDTATDLVYTITPSQVFQTPENYNHRPFPEKTVLDTFTKNSGYVHPDDVDFQIDNYEDILELQFTDITAGANIWAGIDGTSWNVYTHIQTDYEVESINESANGFSLNLTTANIDLNVDEIIGLFNCQNADGLYKIAGISNNTVELLTETVPELPETQLQGRITRFTSVRFDNFNEANSVIPLIEKGISRIWVDETGNGSWSVYDQNSAFAEFDTISADSQTGDNFAAAIDGDRSNRTVVVGAPDEDNGKVYIYSRASESQTLELNAVLEADEDLASPNQRFGASVAIDDTGNFIAVGSPQASNVKSTFAGVYSENESYAENEIAELNDAYWQALVDIRGSVDSIEVGSFQSVPQILLDLGLTNQTSEDVNVLLAGNYPYTNISNVDHFLVKAPQDMFEASQIGDEIELKWNAVSYAHQNFQLLQAVQPFNGSIAEIDGDFVSRRHVISDKIDSVLRFENSDNIPEIGQTVETTTAFATVAYVYANSPVDITVYVKNQNGDFGNSGSATTGIGEFVGEYETVAPIAETANIENFWNGYFKIDLSFTYNVADTAADLGKGLVYTDIIPAGDVDHGFYFNALDFDTDLSSSEDTKNSEVITLTYEAVSGPNGESGIFPSPLWAVRAPAELTGAVDSSTFTPLVETGDSIDLFYNSLKNYANQDWKDPNSIGLSVLDISGTQTIADIWDGYIDFQIQNDYQGRPVEPKVGLTVRDTDFGGTAEVVFYQKFTNRLARVYVKNVSGRFALGDNFNENRTIEYLADGSGSDEFDPAGGSRLIGNILSRSLGLESAGIGKLLVFENPVAIEYAGATSLTDAEYWFYKEEIVNGAPRPANIPGSANNDWLQVYRIPAGAAGNNIGPQNEGLYSIYQRAGGTQWIRVGAFIAAERTANQRLGHTVDISTFNNLQRLFVSTQSNTSDSGKIYVIKNGLENNQRFSWDFGTNKQYAGQFDTNRRYFENDIVFENGKLYSAATNIMPGAFDPADWQTLDQPIDYIGFLPNNTGLQLDNTSVLEQTGLLTFTRDVTVSDTGEVVATSLEYSGDINRIAVYRSINGLFVLTQTITAQNPESNFGASVSLSNDAKYLAVGAPLNDNENVNQGVVYVYEQINGFYELKQLVHPSEYSKALLFGSEVDFDGTTLVVAADNGDSEIETSFDNNQTTFDRSLTDFVDVSANAGTIGIYENLDGYFIYGQTIDYDKEGVRFFGRTIKANNNHVYAGLPKLAADSSLQGTLVDYRRAIDSAVWITQRSIKPAVDVKKIKQIILYDTRENQLVRRLDYIDVNQGKIPGPAEQEIDFKLYYDPAVYTTGQNVQIDVTNSWSEKQVGQIWWDLSNARFVNPYQSSVIYSANNWNRLYSNTASVDILEWTESDIIPSEWDRLSGTEQGFSRGITGTTRYGDNGYVEKRIYFRESKTFATKYYFWVQNKSTVPQSQTRRLSAQSIANLIADPAAEGYQFISLIAPDQWAIFNCKRLIKNQDIALSVQYWTIDDQTINIHNQYQIVTDGLTSSRPSRDVEQKWFDSLVGFDNARRPVPATELSAKEKYGSLNNPRQSWFVNRAEALKQSIDRINRILEQNLIVDEKDISRLTEKEPQPIAQTGKWDRTVETEADLQFIGTARINRAQLSAVVEDGRIIDVDIEQSGRGYQNPPRVEIAGSGTGAEIVTEIDSSGSVVAAVINDSGEYYNDNTQLTVRPFSVLVENDLDLSGKWAIYERTDQDWIRVESQGFDVTQYWQYQDWYAQDYSAFTEVAFVIDQSYQLNSINDSIGDIVKIQSIGTGGWLLLEKIDDQENVDYTVNYKTIGRQNGTIQFSNKLYDVIDSFAGFDVTTFDDTVYDAIPSRETRIILETVRDNLFVDELANEFNQLFFANLRYVFAEQNYVDWAFKTSFVKAQHNVGELEQKVTFQNDNLPNYEDYVNEVKPFKTNIREYLSSYEKLDNTRSMTTDFDLAPKFNPVSQIIEPYSPKVKDNAIIVQDITDYPQKHWLDEVGFSVKNIAVANTGSGYTAAPYITLRGGGGEGAKAVASVGRGGIVSNITVTDPGSGYISAPEVLINGSIADGGTTARAVAQLGGSPVRSIHSQIKFDRVSGQFVFENLETEETFVGTGTTFDFDLEWPMDLRTNKISVFVDNTEVLGGQYTYTNVNNTEKDRERQNGRITFDQAPQANRAVKVIYSKNINLLNAQDRINLLYQPDVGQLGKELGQLMEGIDYGGVQVDSYDFGGTTGWDADPWFTKSWDIYDTVFEDEVLYRKQVTLHFAGTIVPDAFDLDDSKILVQDSTTGTGYVEFIGENTIQLECAMNAQFNTVDHVRIKGQDSTENAIFFEDSSFAIPTEIEETVILENPLSLDADYNIYIKEIDDSGNTVKNLRIDDPNFGTSEQTNLDAVTETITGDGSTQALLLSDYNIVTEPSVENNTVLLVIRKTTSDGAFVPDPDSLDSQVTGGDLAYQTATGLAAGDIITDGDGFVTTTTSAGPEELVPGQVIDTLDIQVFERPAGGSSSVINLNYVGDGTSVQFDMTTLPVKQQNVFVKLNGVYQILEENYYINYVAKTVDFVLAPAESDRVSITILGNSGSEILDIEQFTGNGITTDFLTDVKWSDTQEAFVTVNGQKQSFELLQSDNSFEIAGNTLLRFTEAPAVDSFINVMLLQQDTVQQRNYSETSIDEFISDGSTTEFVLSNEIFQQQPARANTIVQAGDKVLNSGYSGVFEIVQNQTEYQLNLNQIPVGEITFYEVEVYLNGSLLSQPRDYIFESAGVFDSSVSGENAGSGSIIKLNLGVAEAGDTMEVFVTSDGDYRFGFFDSDQQFVEERGTDSSKPVLHLDESPAAGEKIRVYSFSNHNSQGIQRYTLEIEENQEYLQGTSEYFEYRQLAKGVIALREPATDAQWVWVTVNGVSLDPSVDYWLSNDRKYVILVNEPTVGDKIDVFHLAENPITNKYGWRQFKDMLNRTHYKRLGQTFNLAADLHWYDTVIEVDDAADLPSPKFNSRYPGVIFLDGERIEYFVKDGNNLKQLRRGTLGTGIKQLYTAGTKFVEQGSRNTMPYNDRNDVQTFNGDGETLQFQVGFEMLTQEAVEVFVGGRRLRKNSIARFDPLLAQDSPEGDTELPAEFSVEDNLVILNTAPVEGENITIVRKLGTVWSTQGVPLAQSESDISRFLQSQTTDLPR